MWTRSLLTALCSAGGVGFYSELQIEIGGKVRLWQNAQNISFGADRKLSLSSAIAESDFLIVVVTPEAMKRLKDAASNTDVSGAQFAVGRRHMVFPLSYIDVPWSGRTTCRRTTTQCALSSSGDGSTGGSFVISRSPRRRSRKARRSSARNRRKTKQCPGVRMTQPGRRWGAIWRQYRTDA